VNKKYNNKYNNGKNEELAYMDYNEYEEMGNNNIINLKDEGDDYNDK